MRKLEMSGAGPSIIVHLRLTHQAMVASSARGSTLWLVGVCWRVSKSLPLMTPQRDRRISQRSHSRAPR